MSQNFENTGNQVPSKFEKYTNLENSEALLSKDSNVEQKSAQFAELQKEMAAIGVDKNAVFTAMKELKGAGSADEKAKSMMEQLIMGMGEKMFEPDFDIAKAMYKIGKIVAGSELIPEDVKSEFISETKTEIGKQISTEEKIENINNLAKYDDLDFNETLELNANFRKGYSGLIGNLFSKYGNAEVNSAIDELERKLQASKNGSEFIETLSDSTEIVTNATKDLINGFLGLEDAELFFSKIDDKDELIHFLVSEKAQTAATNEPKNDGERPAWMLG